MSDSPEDLAASAPGGAECGAPHAPNAPNRPGDPDLRRINDAWTDLPLAIRRAILAIVEASGNAEADGSGHPPISA